MRDTVQTHPFESLRPETVIDAVESLGLVSDGRMLALNSYENRVYQVGLEEAQPVVVKFYRPGRWSRDQILEEHAFARELQVDELSVVAAWEDAEGRTLHRWNDFLFAVYPRRGGHAPELDPDTLLSLGRYLGIMHGIGATRRFRYRQSLTVEGFAAASRDFLLEHDFIPADLRPAYETLSRDLLERVRQLFASHTRHRVIRLHGDCHRGNILWRDGRAHFVDFDDCMSGPAVQDLWMMLAGSRSEQLAQLAELIEGYSTFHDFNPAELALVEGLRTLRLMHYAAWLARRWDDPAFPRSFPWFNTPRYWSEHILELREQLAALDEEPLALY